MRTFLVRLRSPQVPCAIVLSPPFKEPISSQNRQKKTINLLKSKIHENLPQADTAEQILSESNFQLADTAIAESAKWPDGWTVVDNVLELGIGICALLGGVYGTKAVSFLKGARSKSQALREIIAGNELFKHQNTKSAKAFKNAHRTQSPQTRQLVAEMKIS